MRNALSSPALLATAERPSTRPARADEADGPVAHPTGRPVDAAAAARTGIVSACVALGVMLALTAAFVAWTHRIEPTTPTAAATLPRDTLRARATAGDREAIIEVFRQRVEDPAGTRTPTALMETLYWAERAWAVDDAATRQRLGAFIDQHCDDPMITWNWLCEPGE